MQLSLSMVVNARHNLLETITNRQLYKVKNKASSEIRQVVKPKIWVVYKSKGDKSDISHLFGSQIIVQIILILSGAAEINFSSSRLSVGQPTFQI